LKRNPVLVATILFGTFIQLAAAQATQAPTVEELMNMRSLGATALSPNGQSVAYEIQQPDFQIDSYTDELVVEDVKSGRKIPLPNLEGIPGSFEWSPDGHWLAFVEHPQKGIGQLWIMPATGGTAWQISNSATDIGLFHWSNDSKQVAFLTHQDDNSARTQRLGNFEVVGKDYQQTQIWLVELHFDAGRVIPAVPTPLVESQAFSIADFSWSPDSTKIAFTAADTPLLTAYPSQDVYLLDRSKGGEVRKIVGLPSPDFSPIFSPDGKKIAFLTWLGQRDFFYSNVHIATVDLVHAWEHPATTATAVNDVSASFDENPSLLGWSGNSLYFIAEQKANVHLFRIDNDGHHLEQVTSGNNFVLDGVSFSRDFTRAAMAIEDARHVPELYVTELVPLRLQQITHFTDQVRDLRLATPELVTWKSTDGKVIEGVLYSPSSIQADKKNPLIVDLHGGPADVSRVTLSPDEPIYETQIFVDEGAFVLKPNYRNSSGYGFSFRSANLDNIGESEAADVVSGIDMLVSEGKIDTHRIAVVGSSWGGYLTTWLISHSDRFKAASESSGITDLATNYAVTDNPAIYRQFFHGTPWTAADLYRKNSPISSVTSARTPLLLQQGRDDRRVPPANAYELYRALQDTGIESRLILYSGFGHGFNSPKEMRAATQTNIDWFNYYLWGKDIPADSPLWGSSERIH
jgi:dipeptidyl aminopeptidase/acylaminoacyl peptidase